MSARLHPQISALLDARDAAPAGDGPPDLQAIRADYVRTAIERGGAVEPVDAARDVSIPRGDGATVRGRAYVPLGGPRTPGRLVWFHGGGWCVGDLDGFDRVCRSLANGAGCEVLSVDYRLAPEAVFPAAVEDADAAVAWALGQEGPVVVGGDSAGGNLAAVAVRRAPAGAVRAQVLVYPATDAAMAGDSYAADEQPGLTAADMAACWTAYRGEAAPEDPDLSPLRADLAGMPATLVAVAGVDVLRSDGEAYAGALEAAGVDVRLSRYEDMAHGFLRWGGVVDRARELIDEIAGFTAARLAA